MFAPSFVTGHLISRFGLTRIMLIGAVLLLLCSLINLSGLANLNFWAANVALGVGWNFLFVGATTLLTRAYAGTERGKVQALNDFLVFGTSLCRRSPPVQCCRAPAGSWCKSPSCRSSWSPEWRCCGGAPRRE
jgi:hypothetical protein